MLPAEALMEANQLGDALALCDESLRIARDTNGRSYEIDTERLREAISRRSAGIHDDIVTPTVRPIG